MVNNQKDLFYTHPPFPLPLPALLWESLKLWNVPEHSVIFFRLFTLDPSLFPRS